jgi:hypothetical protein
MDNHQKGLYHNCIYADVIELTTKAYWCRCVCSTLWQSFPYFIIYTDIHQYTIHNHDQTH